LVPFWLGKTIYPSGRFGEAPSIGISKTLELAGFKLGRLKTGKKKSFWLILNYLKFLFL
jgi:tRNA U34 5-carboxymethylaminomethyl modifying enzyme MnmG/GidA